MNGEETEPTFDVVVVGAGAAGVGVAVALNDAGVANYIVLERDRVGASFAAWPAETRFITPSFATNSVGMLDLNSVAIGVSPAYSLEVEHPSGPEYAAHLQAIVNHFGVPVRENTDVTEVVAEGARYRIMTSDGPVMAWHVVWAAGEFQYPRRGGFAGSELCRHTATVDSYGELQGDDFIVIGGFESGFDAAFHLAYQDKRVRLFDGGCPWEKTSSDPSVSLSPYTLERIREDWFLELVELFPNTRIESVKRLGEAGDDEEDAGYEVVAADGSRHQVATAPLLAGGFDGSHRLIADLFELRSDGMPQLTTWDESTLSPGIFLVGASVRHDNHIFCFIYKYRQRFAVVAKAIAESLGLPAERLESYRTWGMYLDDLSVCGEDCAC